MQDRFQNPANGTTYTWPINHSDEEESGKTRTIERTANTGSVGAVKQQGDDGPIILRWKGTILTRAQLVAMWTWFNLCRTQTIYLRDFDGQEYEGQITTFTPQRKRTLRNPRDTSAPNHYWTYSFEFEVYRFVSGDMLTAGVTP
jgi:hypothetical protein